MTNSTQSRFGFSNFAETWNGRLAILGFIISLGTELLTGQGIISQIGFGTGSSKSIFDMDYPLTASRGVGVEAPANFDVRVEHHPTGAHGLLWRVIKPGDGHYDWEHSQDHCSISRIGSIQSVPSVGQTEINNWKTIAEKMAASGDTESWFYLRAKAIADRKQDPMPNISQLMPESAGLKSDERLVGLVVDHGSLGFRTGLVGSVNGFRWDIVIH